jgi:hypothetical protein
MSGRCPRIWADRRQVVPLGLLFDLAALYAETAAA